MNKWILSSVAIAFLVSVASLLGIFNHATYAQETANWRMQAVGQDIGNVLAVIVLLVSMYFLHKKVMKAYFLWLGSLFYLIYAYVIYAFFVHFNFLFLVYVAILGLSIYTVIGGIIEQNIPVLVRKFTGKKRAASTILISTGTLFVLLWLSEIIPALISGEKPKSIVTAGLWVNPVQVIDLAVVLPSMIITGVLLLRKRMLGYFFAAPWLTFSVLMGGSIVATMLLDLKNGNSEAFFPLVMIGLIVLASIVVLYTFLAKE